MKAIAENSETIYELRYCFFNSGHIKEIMGEISPKSYDEGKVEYANSLTFFKVSSTNQNMMAQLWAALTKYGISRENRCKDSPVYG